MNGRLHCVYPIAEFSSDLGLLQSGVWRRFSQFASTNPVMSKWVQGICRSIINSKAASTALIYRKWFKKFSKFCHDEKVPLEEVTCAEVLLFAQDLIGQGWVASSVARATSAMYLQCIVLCFINSLCLTVIEAGFTHTCNSYAFASTGSLHCMI